MVLLNFAIAVISARPQFFTSSSESVESSSLEDGEIEGRHFAHRYPYNYRRPFVGGHFGQMSGHFGQMENQYAQMGGHFAPVGGFPSNGGPFSFGTGDFGPSNNQFFGPS